MDYPEARETYAKARKKGMKTYSSHISEGKNGYLPFLEGILKNKTIVSEVNLGINEIPLSKIKGTYTRSRSLSFSADFMPIMNINTEFFDKWVNVAKAHMNEGLRDPIKVYEYLNWFYVIEGNKRVSVLKYNEVYSFRAEIIRLVPKYDSDDKTIRLYYEFLDFYNKTNVMSIWFSKENNFNTIYQYMDNYKPENNIHKNKYIAFEKDVYKPFRNLYHKLGGKKLKITTGDALLEYIKLYGIPSVDSLIISEKVENRISNLIKELSSLYDKDEIEISTKESTESSSFVSQVTSFLKPKRTLKVAFLYAKTTENSNWSYSHELGRIHVQSKFKDSIITDIYENIPESKKAYEKIKEIAKHNYDVIFATSPAFVTSTLKVAIDHPDTIFFNCSQSYSFKHMTTYFGRIYEPRFLAGIIAGSLTSTNIIGYAGSFPIPEIICSINAFALGAKLVNPNAKIHVEWLNKWDPKDDESTVSNAIVKAGADIILHNATIGKNFKSSEYGLYTLVCDVKSRDCIPDKYLASPIWNWGMFYEKILESVINNSFKYVNSVSGSNKKHVNFWWGMDTGVVDFIYSKRLVPERTQKLIEYVKKGICDDLFSPFEGPIYSNDHKLKIEDGKRASVQELLSMDWFVDNVDTQIKESGFKQPDANLFTGRIE